jgi:hypothetical protein
MTVLIETPSEELDALTAELAWCLQRFVTGRADDPAMRRAEQALVAWKELSDRETIDLRSG